jgi:hypothetical protein
MQAKTLIVLFAYAAPSIAAAMVYPGASDPSHIAAHAAAANGEQPYLPADAIIKAQLASIPLLAQSPSSRAASIRTAIALIPFASMACPSLHKTITAFILA